MFTVYSEKLKVILIKNNRKNKYQTKKITLRPLQKKYAILSELLIILQYRNESV